MWTYESMYKWYTKQDMIKNDLYQIVYPIIYHSKRPSKKDLNKIEPFIKQNIVYVGESPLQNEQQFPNGVYLLYATKPDPKQWLYFVTPKKIQCLNSDQTEVMANHLSFCYDKSDKNKACHFHNTEYYCLKKGNNIEYRYDHHNDFFPDKLESLDNIIKNAANAHIRDFTIDLIQYPGKQKASGGGRKNKPDIARPITNNVFCQHWHTYKLKSITCFGVKQENEMVFTIKVVGPGRIVNTRLYPAFVLKCRVGDNYEVLIQEFLAQTIPLYFPI